MAKFQIIVSHKDFSDSAEHMEAGHDWSVEGDYGFLGSFKTEGQAWAFAQEEAANLNDQRGEGTVEVQLSA